MWSELNKLTKNKANKTNVELKDQDGRPIPNEAVSTQINNFFASIGRQLAQKFGTALPIPPTPTDDMDVTDTQLTLNEITSTQLYNEVKQINIYKSSGISGISSRLIKDAMLIMIDEFTFLLNKSIATGNIPSAWKIATVIPIPKVANSHNVSDLRPISLLPLPGKYLKNSYIQT